MIGINDRTHTPEDVKRDGIAWMLLMFDLL